MSHAEGRRKRARARVLPLFHVFAMTTVMTLPLSLGAEVILVPRFNLEDLLKDHRDRAPHVFPGVPTIFTAINNHSGVRRSNWPP